MLLIERVDFQRDGERFSFSVTARRQTAANFSALFQMAALCRDAATDGGACWKRWRLRVKLNGLKLRKFSTWFGNGRILSINQKIRVSKCMTEEETNERYKELCRQREERDKTACEISERYDKWILTLSAGALAVSLTFLEKIAPSPEINTLFLIGWAWAFLILSLIAGILAILVSQYAIQKQIEEIDKKIEELSNDDLTNNANNSNNVLISFCHIFTIGSAICFVLGIIFLCCFAYTNLCQEIKQ